MLEIKPGSGCMHGKHPTPCAITPDPVNIFKEELTHLPISFIQITFQVFLMSIFYYCLEGGLLEHPCVVSVIHVMRMSRG